GPGTMFVESINDVLFLVDFFTIILPALTAIGIAFLLRECRAGEQWKSKRTDGPGKPIPNPLLGLDSTDFLIIIYHRITTWIRKVFRMNSPVNDEED
uniref:MifM-stalling construct n=1 Tax=Bacillus subtilis (strain 168) TaxID=224308 RepID=UPI001EAE839F|nr:Chain h, MifM-stalling construct [Bacillus subtilis subsp. subtilis str. 168]